MSIAEEQRVRSCLSIRIFEVENKWMDFLEIQCELYVIGPSMVDRVVMLLACIREVSAYDLNFSPSG